jgi:hypothetical protein
MNPSITHMSPEGERRKAIVATARNESRTETCVSCPTCFCEIPLVGTRLPAEFSVPCPKCGRRNVYHSADAHDSKGDAEAAKTSARTLFATERKKTVPPKSWLNECATWLLQ